MGNRSQKEKKFVRMAYKSKFFLCFAIFSLILMISSVSAFEFDNVKTYDPDTKTVTIKDCSVWLVTCLVEGDDITNITLNNPLSYKVIRGDDRLVAELFFDNYEDTNSLFNAMDFYDRLDNDREFQREFVYKMKNEYQVDEKIYYQVCEEKELANKSIEYYDCVSIENGTKKITKYNWIEINKENGLPEGEITIGIFTDVLPNEVVEWIPTWGGVRIEEFAEWNETFIDGLVGYWSADHVDDSSSVAIDSYLGLNNLTTIDGNPVITDLHNIIDDAYSFDGTADGMTESLNWATHFDDNIGSMCAWVNSSSLDVDQIIFMATGDFQLWLDHNDQDWKFNTGGTDLVYDTTVNTNQKYFVCGVCDSGDVYLYLDGVEVASSTGCVVTGVDTGDVQMGNYNGGNDGWIGGIDEVGVWNRSLSATEIESLYNGGTGLTYSAQATPDNIPNVTLSIPANNTFSTDKNLIFNWSAEDDSLIENSTLWINGILNETIDWGTSNETTFQVTKGFPDGSYNYTVSAFDNATQEINATEEWYFTIDTTVPVLSDLQNLTNIVATLLPTSSYWNYTASDTNLDVCFYNTTDNATLTFITCNVSTITTEWIIDGAKTVTYCANDSGGLETCASSQINVTGVSYTVTESEDPTGEYQDVIYTLKVNSTNIPTTTAYFFMNNTIYDVTGVATSDYVDFSKTLSIPGGWGNGTGRLIDWYWNFTIVGLVDNQTTTVSNTTIYALDIDDCSSYGDVILNMSLYDEKNNSFINVSAETTNIEIDLSISSGSFSLNYSKQWTDQNNASVCVPLLLLNTTSYIYDFIIGYDAGDHVNEFFYMDNGTLDNTSIIDSLTTKKLNLMDLLTTDSTSFLFNYFDEDGLFVDDIIVHVFRKYIGEGVFREVERAKQNDDGDTIVHLVEEDVLYYFIISQYGQILFTSNTYTALCQDTPCEIQLEESGGFQEFSSDWDLVDNGGYSITSSSVTRIVNLTYALTTPSEMNISVYALGSDGSYDSVGSSQTTGTSGSITVLVPVVSGNTSFFASVYQDDDFKKSQWIDFEDDLGLYLGNTLSLFLGALIILALGLMAVSEGAGVMIFLLLGMFVSMILGLVDYRTSTGLSVFIYFVIAGGIIIWKTTRRNR